MLYILYDFPFFKNANLNSQQVCSIFRVTDLADYENTQTDEELIFVQKKKKKNHHFRPGIAAATSESLSPLK